jgi:hypothetical protein
MLRAGSFAMWPLPASLLCRPDLQDPARNARSVFRDCIVQGKRNWCGMEGSFRSLSYAAMAGGSITACVVIDSSGSHHTTESLQ